MLISIILNQLFFSYFLKNMIIHNLEQYLFLLNAKSILSFYSIKMAADSTVVHNPSLFPVADCTKFFVWNS